ncbi:MAG: IS1182 family transposase [Actinobacteria bacterium]|nr:IS1182 family transposase [Actinomycetota bacterium]
MQGSLLETRQLRRHLVTKGSFYERLADHGHEIVADEDFAGLYAEGRGRPSVPPSVMIRAMLCATHDRTTDRETSRRSRVDLDWKSAMGVDDDFPGIAATTFSLMRARMLTGDADATLFKATLAKAVASGIFKEPLTAIIDSSPVHGAGAVADTYELIRKMMGRVARAAGDRLAEDTRKSAVELAEVKPDFDWQDPAARRAHLKELIEQALDLLAEVEASGAAEDPGVADAVDLLDRVIDQDVEIKPDGPDIRQGVAPDRVPSHSDPEMRHGRKSASRRFDGHKLDVIIDENSELVLGIDVRPGNAGDGDGAAPLLEAVQSIDGIDVGVLLGDMAYSDGDVRVAVEEQGAELVAKVPPVTNRGRFPKTEFHIVLDPDPVRPGTFTGTVTCPAGNTTSDARPAKDHKNRPATEFRFDANTCAACPLKDQCTTSATGRKIGVGRHEPRINSARAAQQQPQTRALLRRRPKVERKIDHLQDLGMRQARYRGRRRTRLQALLAATVANFKRLVVIGAFPGTTVAAA